MGARRRRADSHHEAEAQADRREVRGRDRGALRGLTGEAGTSNESLELGRRAWTLFNEGRAEEFWALVHPECVIATDPRWPGGGEFRGIAEFRRFMSQFLEAFEGIQFQDFAEPETVGDAALFNGRWVGLGAHSGIETTSVPFWVVYRSRDGLVSEARFFFDEERAREDASRT